MTVTLAIKQSEYEERLAGLAEHLLERQLTGAVLFDPYYVLYYAGFAFAPTERPIAFVLNAEGKGGMLVPRLEREHAQANSSVDHVADYPEYPSETHPLESLRGLLEEMGVKDSFGADQDGYPWVLGYRGPSLTELTGTTPQRITAFVEDQMAVKSPAEVELIRESSKWGNLAHVLLHGRVAGHCFRGDQAGRSLLRRRPSRARVLRRAPYLGVLEAPRRSLHRPPLSRRPFPRHWRRHGDQARDGVHGRAWSLRR